ncbi:hypothetical protein FDP41_005357 [Naegleria fowleri]|uniref:Beta-lactamase-related domain-containing protein n=1 Tax=Naegleria fowleri TaxID=5763 RepID=A0A6A5BBQ6_NAEFO|nr:uncharacterized protein FDP41_006028 [Naegleria fowleri]XP_044560076.1 uncharacterized protein FDP41_005357 [Naegleria fowleri]KAF0974923.1 hypothetical protein FDP41_006028 [Naegleria fowleri]KAF0975363.1 hypothetical protein FDP41_005357 [Naegleria fowleri]
MKRLFQQSSCFFSPRHGYTWLGASSRLSWKQNQAAIIASTISKSNAVQCMHRNNLTLQQYNIQNRNDDDSNDQIPIPYHNKRTFSFDTEYNHNTMKLMKIAALLCTLVGSGLAWYLLKGNMNQKMITSAQEGCDDNFQQTMKIEPLPPSSSSQQQTLLSPIQKQQLDLIFQSFKETVSSPGMQIAISQNGSLIYNQCFGFSNVENRIPVHENTKFRIASISKPISSVALALMIEKGLVNLDKPIFHYLSEESKKKIPSELIYKGEKFNTITLRQLASHLSGVRDYNDVEKEFMSWTKNYRSIIDACEMFIQDELVNKPGDKYSYSTYGYTLMSAVMEDILKAQSENPSLTLETKIFLQNAKDFKSFCKKHIFDVLEMNNTTFDEKDKIIYNRSSFYMRDTSGENAYELLNVPSVDNSYKWAGGGMLSTCQDLLKFANGLQKLLPPSQYRQLIDQTLWISQKTNEGLPTQYGIGFVVKTIRLNGKEEKLVYHTGGACGCCSILWMVPSRGISIAMIVNILHAKRMTELCEEVTRLLCRE